MVGGPSNLQREVSEPTGSDQSNRGDSCCYHRSDKQSSIGVSRVFCVLCKFGQHVHAQVVQASEQRCRVLCYLPLSNYFAYQLLHSPIGFEGGWLGCFWHSELRYDCRGFPLGDTIRTCNSWTKEGRKSFLKS